MNILTSETAQAQDRFLFRAWDKVHKIMIYPVKANKWIGAEGEYYPVVIPREDITHDFQLELMQCTGRRTEDGTPIYEGDFVASDYKRQADYEIIFSGGRFLARHHFFKYGEMQYNDFDLCTRNLCHVIGNKFENPELMEVNK